jgi:hypothetical protein
VACAAVLYAVRGAVRGVARSERVARIGGTALVGQEVMDWTYWAVEPIVRGLVAVGITANGATWIALVLGLAPASRLVPVVRPRVLARDVVDAIRHPDGQIARLTNPARTTASCSTPDRSLHRVRAHRRPRVRVPRHVVGDGARARRDASPASWSATRA